MWDISSRVSAQSGLAASIFKLPRFAGAPFTDADVAGPTLSPYTVIAQTRISTAVNTDIPNSTHPRPPGEPTSKVDVKKVPVN